MTEYQSAIVREISVLKIFEMGLRPMNAKVVQSYSKLGLYEMVVGNRSRALYFLHKSLLLMLVNYGETYPDILVTFANIARIYQQDKESKNAVNCYLKALELVRSVNCKYHINISFCCSSLASLHYEMKEFKKAIEYQTESVATLCTFFSYIKAKYSTKKTPDCQTPKRSSRFITTWPTKEMSTFRNKFQDLTLQRKHKIKTKPRNDIYSLL